MSARSRASIGGASRRACPERREAPRRASRLRRADACAWQSIGPPLAMARACGSAVTCAAAQISGREINLPSACGNISGRFAFGLSAADRSPIARWHPLQCSHISDRHADPFPSLLGKVARSAGWGVARCFDAKTDCTTVTANLRSKRPAFHTPSVAFGDTFPASRRRGRPAAARRLDDLCERRSGAPAGRSDRRRAPAALRRGGRQALNIRRCRGFLAGRAGTRAD